MTISVDPQGMETFHLQAFAGDFKGKRILEIGSGDGRLVERYAGMSSRVVGIDPDEKKVQRAVQNLPPGLRDIVEYNIVNLEQYAAQRAGQDSPGTFDLVILGWSL